MLRQFLPLLVIVPLAGCALPPALVVASYAADGVLLLTSGKTSTDHLLSMVEKRDCAVWRVVKNESICQDFVAGRDPYDDWRDPGEVQVVHVDDSAMPVDLAQQVQPLQASRPCATAPMRRRWPRGSRRRSEFWSPRRAPANL